MSALVRTSATATVAAPDDTGTRGGLTDSDGKRTPGFDPFRRGGS